MHRNGRRCEALVSTEAALQRVGCCPSGCVDDQLSSASLAGFDVRLLWFLFAEYVLDPIVDRLTGRWDR